MSYDNLIAHIRTTKALEEVSGLISWDQETVMPSGGADQRAEEQAALEEVIHARRTDPKIGDWLAGAGAGTPEQEACLRLIRRDYDRNTKVPVELASALARARSQAHTVWAGARKDEDVAAFLPALTQVLDLRREEAAAIAGEGDPYDALLNDYEPGATSAEISALFDTLRGPIVDLRARVLDCPQPAPIKGDFAPAAQRALSQEIAACFGYDLTRGRIDEAVHPFSQGSGDDVRITTRVDSSDPMGALYSTIHEVGHAVYEQGIDSAYTFTPLGGGVSMGVHESQSRICENQLGRSRAFMDYLFPRMAAHLGDLPVVSPQALYAAINRVEQGFIRTESDELGYNLHVFLRFDLEQGLIRGDLQAADLEAAWNDRFHADFGLEVPKPSLGVLQDVHWAEGLFGYFPTYSLGNVYAGCLHSALRRDLPGLDGDLSGGDLAPAIGWLHDKIHRHGQLYTPGDLITNACGEAPDPKHLIDYLTEKFSALNGL